MSQYSWIHSPIRNLWVLFPLFSACGGGPRGKPTARSESMEELQRSNSGVERQRSNPSGEIGSSNKFLRAFSPGTTQHWWDSNILFTFDFFWVDFWSNKMWISSPNSMIWRSWESKPSNFDKAFLHFWITESHCYWLAANFMDSLIAGDLRFPFKICATNRVNVSIHQFAPPFGAHSPEFVWNRPADGRGWYPDSSTTWIANCQALGEGLRPLRANKIQRRQRRRRRELNLQCVFDIM